MANPSITDPTKKYNQPPFPKQQELEWPGLDSQMDPQPDWGQDSYKGSGKLAGRVALITGGDSGIGRAVAIAFAREGANVAISYLPQEQADAEQCKQFVERSGAKCLLLPGDLRQKAYCSQIVEDTVKEFGKITTLVNNAAKQGKAVGSLAELDYERVAETFTINILSFFETSKAAVAHMKPGSTIINTGSIQAYKPSEEILDYATTKAAIVGFTKGLSSELIEKGIRVNCVAPGPFWTPLVCASFPKDKIKEFGAQNAPMKRPGQPAELAGAYVYLASEDSSFTTGEILAVTGGGITA